MKFEAYMLDVFTGFIYPSEIIIEEGIIKDVTPIVVNDKYETDLEGILLPGFIDSHIHIESSMLTPSEFAKMVVRHGTTSVVADCHEIANVMGFDGVTFMINNGLKVPFNFYFTAPSCVPATPFEDNGAIISSEDIEKLLKKDNIVALGEMMNFPGVINGDEEVLKKLDISKKLNKPIDGHCPLLTGDDLAKYVSEGISTDHESSTFNEALEKKNLGMKIMVREGSSAKNMEELFNLHERINYWKSQDSFGFIRNYEFEKQLNSPIFDFIVCDDISCNDLKKGHLNKLIKKANSFDVDIIEAIKMVTINPANHYGLNEGAIINGRKANLVLIDNLEDFNIKMTMVNGEVVYKDGVVLFDSKKVEPLNTFDVNKKSKEDFDVSSDMEKVNVNIIELVEDELITLKSNASLEVKNNIIQPNKEIQKIAVVERYGLNTIANGFVKGFNLKEGAIASSVSHDSHNIVVVGTNSDYMAEAVNMIIENQGGLSFINSKYKKIIPLPIGGIMSNLSCNDLSKKLDEIESLVNDNGINLDSPFITLSFMALLVIPSLKISNRGLFDVDNFEFIDLIYK